MANAFLVEDLFALKATLEAQIEADFIDGENAQGDGAFNFLVGEWDLERTSFRAGGSGSVRSTGTAAAKYVFGGRIIQEEFTNYRADGTAFRGGTALYTFSPSAKQWHVAAADASTGAVSYLPKWVNNEVHYESVVSLPGREIYTKSRIFNISSSVTEWEQEVSIDGAAWFPNYHIISRRRK